MLSPTLKPQETDGATSREGRWMVVIHDNDTNSMDEVMMILMKATGCSADEAYMEMWEAHTHGKAPVHFADREECERVAAVIETIGVRTTVCLEWGD